MNELRHAARQLVKSPAFTAVAILVLALGIGANTAMFSVMNALLFKPLAVKAPAEIVRVFSQDERPQGGFRSFSYPNYADIRTENAAFTELAAFTMNMVGVREGDTTRRLFAASVSANYLRTFGVRPALGRDFLPEEERPGAGIAVAMVSHGYWRSHGGDASIVGQTLTVSGRLFEIIGVAPEGFTGTTMLFSPDLWVPLGMHHLLANDFRQEKGRSLDDRSNHGLFLVGRMKPGLTPRDAEARLKPVAARLAEAYPKENEGQGFVVTPPARLSLNSRPQSESELRYLALLLLPMAGVILLIACLNLANMFLARGAARQREFAIRAALGGGRWRLARQLLVEGLLLSVAGGALALGTSGWLTQLLLHSLGSKLPFMSVVFDARPDLRVLAATLGFCMAATLLSALLPALRLSQVDIIHDLKEHGGEGRQALRGFGLFSLRGLLVTGQVALSFVLITVAGLFLRGALNAAQANPGFRFEQGILAEVDASLAGYEEAKARQVYRQALESVRALPGVQNASLASSIAFGMFADSRQIHRPGASQRLRAGGSTGRSTDGAAISIGVGGDDAAVAVDEPFDANYVIISDDYFRSLGTALLRGREFDRLEAQGESPARVAILNEVAARRLWPEGDPIGRQVEIVDTRPDAEPLVLTVVGIAPPFRAQLGDEQPTPHLYVPFGHPVQAWLNLHVRVASDTPGSDKALLGSVRDTLRAIDDRLPVLSISTLSDFHNEGVVMWMFRAGTRLFLGFGGLALALAVVGVYGLKSFVVARRTREIGIRIALGATRWQVLWMVLRDGLKLTATGLLVGIPLALATGQLLRSALYRVNGADPVTFVSALVMLVVAVLLATFIPARRAAAVQPVTALRRE